MITEDGEWITCDGPDPNCEQKIKNHAWGKIKAEGWFMMKDDKSYCPNHIPDWVKKWRK